MGTLGRFLFWDYKRASWQYDVMVGLILAFIFLTPRDVFRDQPRAASVVMLPAEQGAGLFWIEPSLLDGVPEPQLVARAAAIVNAKFKSRRTVSHVEPIRDEAEQEVKGYMAFTTP
jgi:hypothetical protein